MTALFQDAAKGLGVPGRVVTVEGEWAIVDFWGVHEDVRLDMVDEEILPGDYILNHVGFATRRIPRDEIQGTLALYDMLLAHSADGTEGVIRAAHGAYTVPDRCRRSC